MWTLVYILLIGNITEVKVIGTYDDMISCFYARESLSKELNMPSGYFPANSQAVCINRKYERT